MLIVFVAFNAFGAKMSDNNSPEPTADNITYGTFLTKM